MTQNISAWADRMLDNHMAHIQKATEEASQAIVNLAIFHREMLTTQEKLVLSLGNMKENLQEHISFFHEYMHENSHSQGTVLTTLELIKSHQETTKEMLATIKERQISVLAGIENIKRD